MVLILKSRYHNYKTLNTKHNKIADNLEEVFQVIENPLFIVDLKSKELLKFNESALKLMSNYDKAIQQNFEELINCCVVDSDKVLNQIYNSTKCKDLELQLKKDSTIYTILLNSDRLTYLKRQVFLITLKDITIQKKLSEEVLFTSEHDALTGLYNRHSFDKHINELLHWLDRYAGCASLIIADIDHFKKVNDTWGHPVGDTVLIETAERLKKGLRETDFLARIGGEEFIIILPQTSVTNAVVVAEKMRQQMDKIDFHDIGHLTASFGVAQWQKGDTYIDWYKRVDRALYYAKETGRNKVANASTIGNAPILSIHLEWNTSFESGNKHIDNQHQELFEAGRQFIQFVFVAKSGEDFITGFENIISHIQQHFIDEEEILLQINYNEYSQHKDIHKNLLEKAYRLIDQAKNNYDNRIKLVEYIVQDVIYNHLALVDSKYFEFTKK